VNIIISVFLQARKQIVDCILPVMTKKGVEKKHQLLLDESHINYRPNCNLLVHHSCLSPLWPLRPSNSS
jgi:hypothetical protein